jgi:hypothetical protein
VTPILKEGWHDGKQHVPDWTPLRIADRNPILDTRKYEVTESYATNLIAENLYSQVNAERHETLFLDYFLEHKKDSSVVFYNDQYTCSYNRNRIRRITPQGWKSLIQWKEGSTSWEP